MASLIISDTHFGLDSSTLRKPAKVDQLMQEISEFGGGCCDEVVLLGDIFDFWRVRPENAVRASIPLLKRLSRDNLKIRYVVGNHDHHLVVQKQESEFMERAARGDLYPIYIPSLCWRLTFCGLDIEMLYPTYRARCGNRTFLFTHGHHLDGVQTFTLQLVEKLRRLSGEEFLPADLEMMMTYAYESIYRSACIGEMVFFEDSIWKASSLLQRFAVGIFSHQRMASVEGQYGAILKFIRDHNIGKIDCFIYGDTHRVGIFQREGGPLAVNTGCFTCEQGNGPRLETANTYILMDEGGMAIRQLGRKKPLYLCELF
ncbi:MAG: metallophosphoesterase family protein [Methanotrichaceae archaeon]|nr:metallophosphoesterase family protein [Methanotrichaceae archaeon]